MTSRIVSYEMSDEERKRTALQRTLRESGGSPDGVLLLVGAVLEERTWERLPVDKGGPPFSSFTEFVRTEPPFGLGLEIHELEKILSVSTRVERAGGKSKTAEEYAHIRARAKKQLHMETPAANKQGRPEKGSGTTITDSSKTSDGILARLKRDDPALAEQVITGDLSANAAAIKAGIRRRTFRVDADDPARIAEALKRRLAPDVLDQLKKLL